MGAVVTVHLLRHGEVYNPGRVLYGRLPGYRLSDLGIAQAQRAADWLAQHDIGYIASSPLERAQETAARVAAVAGLEVTIDERLIEADNLLQGREVAGGKGLLRDPANWKYFRNPFRPSWGEPYAQIAERVLAAVHVARDAAVLAGSPGVAREAVCVSHQLPIVTARRAFEGRRLYHDPRKRQCGLASITSFTFDDAGNVEVRYTEPAADLPTGRGAGA